MSAAENKVNVNEKAISSITKSLGERLKETSDEQTYDNMKLLCDQDEYEIPEGSGIKYKRKILKPKELVELNKLQKEMETLDDDPEKRMDVIKRQAMICLEGLTKEKWEQTDGVLMEIIVGACFLISKGFRKVRRPSS